MAFPSLRTHKPILPGAIHRDHAGEMFEFHSCRPRRSPDRFQAAQEPNLLLHLAQTDRDASVHEPAHADIHRYAQRQERKQHRGSTVTH